MPAHITFNVDEDLKKKFDRKIRGVGITQTKALTDFMRYVVSGSVTLEEGVTIIE